MTPHEYRQATYNFLTSQGYDVTKIYSVEVRADDKILIHQHLTTENGNFVNARSVHARSFQTHPSPLYDAKGDLVPQHHIWNKYKDIVNEAVQWTTTIPCPDFKPDGTPGG